MNFSFITQTIIQLKKINTSIIDTIKVVGSAIEKLKLMNKQMEVKEKTFVVTEKNLDFIDFPTINDIMIIRYSPKNFKLSCSEFKYAQITSVDMERSFSCFKNILRHTRKIGNI